MAPAYGEDDYRICRKEKIELVDPLNENCAFTNEIKCSMDFFARMLTR